MKLTYIRGFCVYCGKPAETRRWPTWHRPITCSQHSDLPDRDPHYAQPGDQWSGAR